MKLFFGLLSSVLCLTFTTPAMAAGSFPEGIEAVRFIQGNVVQATPLCPAGAQCVTNGTQLAIAFTMGCLDSFGEYDYTLTADNQLVFAMIGMINEKSRAVRCIVANTKIVNVTLNMVFPPFDIKFMGGDTVSVPAFTK